MGEMRCKMRLLMYEVIGWRVYMSCEGGSRLRGKGRLWGKNGIGGYVSWIVDLMGQLLLNGRGLKGLGSGRGIGRKEVRGGL